jgi:hypothetical protein
MARPSSKLVELRVQALPVPLPVAACVQCQCSGTLLIKIVHIFAPGGVLLRVAASRYRAPQLASESILLLVLAIHEIPAELGRESTFKI